MIIISIKKNHPITPKQVVNVYDLGYFGVEKDFPEQLSSLPYKKKRNQDELSQEEKEYNKIHSKKRIVIEHVYLQYPYGITGVFSNAATVTGLDKK